MRIGMVGIAVLVVATGCSRKTEPDAYGTFETTDVLVSAEAPGQLLAFAPSDGDRLVAGTVVGVIDTTQLMLERNQLLAQQSAVEARATEAGKQTSALLIQRDIAKRSYDRTQRLFAQQAATAQQLDQAEREYRVLGEQLEASRALRTSTQREITSSEARVAQIGERLRKSHITNPVTGTVLVAYMKRGETVQQGQPLYKIANLDSMLLRAYVTETQLAHARIGQQVRVSIDAGEGRRTISGTVIWVSSQSEFTPTPIQTRDERASLVYAVKIRVLNTDGSIKVGMPADVQFVTQAAAK